MQNVQHRICFKCRWEGKSAERLCPRCRRPTQTRGFIRGTGAVLAALGGFLLVLMSVITVAVIGLIAQSGKPGSGQFTGTKTQMILMFGVFGFVLLFGFVSLIAGLWQLVFGRRNMILVYFILFLGAVFLIGGTIFRLIVGE